LKRVTIITSFKNVAMGEIFQKNLKSKFLSIDLLNKNRNNNILSEQKSVEVMIDILKGF